MNPEPDAPRPWSRWGSLLAPLAAGAALRLHGLGQQILGGDEWHAVRSALEHPLRENLFGYRSVDFCQPLASLYRLWILAGGALSEGLLRVPIVVSSLLLIWLVPRLVERLVSRGTAVALAWAIALSPNLIVYGRIVRSYTPATLLVTLAGLAFFLWWQRGERRRLFGALYAVLAPAAVYFHLGTAVLAASPFLYALLDLLRRRSQGEPVRERLAGLAWLGSLSLAGVAVFVLPSWSSLLEVAAAKRGGATPGAAALLGALQLRSGSKSVLVAVLFWATAALGWWLLYRKRPAFALFTGTLVAAHVIGLGVLSPFGINWTLALNRYLVFFAPLLLTWVAAGLTEWTPRRIGKGLATAGGLGLLLVTGPVPGWVARVTPFQHHSIYLDFSEEAHLPASDVPAFYLELATREPGALLEAPFPNLWNNGTLFPLYQEHHRREVLVSPAEAWLFQPGRTRWRNLVPMEREAILASRARYLVLHPRLLEEEARCQAAAHIPPVLEREALPVPSLDPALIERALRLWGEPIYRDEWILAWDLERVRGRR